MPKSFLIKSYALNKQCKLESQLNGHSSRLNNGDLHLREGMLTFMFL